jgi:hypothetical protein
MLTYVNNDRASAIGLRFAKFLLLLVLCKTVVDCQSPSIWLSGNSTVTGTSAHIQEPWNW